MQDILYPHLFGMSRDFSKKRTKKSLKKILAFFREICYYKQAAEMRQNLICGRGGTGRRARLRGVWATVWVQVPSAAPDRSKRFELALFVCISLFLMI